MKKRNHLKLSKYRESITYRRNIHDKQCLFGLLSNESESKIEQFSVSIKAMAGNKVHSLLFIVQKAILAGTYHPKQTANNKDIEIWVKANETPI